MLAAARPRHNDHDLHRAHEDKVKALLGIPEGTETCA
jgi:hypothetical protein